MSARAPSPRLLAWSRSDRSRKRARAMTAAFNAEKASGPVCGAKTKKTGEPCQIAPMENGRCYLHGGLTPRGDAWHLPRWPARDSRTPEAKLLRKLETLKRRQAARDAHLAAMTVEQRAKHETWLRHHRPGSAAARRAACDELRQNAETAAGIAALDAPRPPSLEAQALADLAAWLEAEAVRIEAAIQGDA